MDSARLRPYHALAAILVPLFGGLLVAAFALVWSDWSSRRESATARLQDAAQYLAMLIERELAVETGVLEAMAQSPLIDRRDWSTLHRMAVRIASQRPGSVIAFADESGQLLVNSHVPYGEPLPNLQALEHERREVSWRGTALPVSTRGLTRIARETGKPVYSDLYLGLSTETPNLAVAVPVEREGRRTHALTYVFSANAIAEFIAARNRFPGALAQVLDREGRIIASSRNQAALLAHTAPSFIRSASAAPRTILDGDTRKWVVVGADIAPAGWKLVLTVPEQDAYAAANLSAASWLVVMLLVTGAVGYLLWRLSHRLAGQTAETLQLADELREADHRKNQFLARLAHEMRNPLGPLTNAVHLLAHPTHESAAERARLQAIMKRQLKHLACLVEDLLDVTRIAEGKIELRPVRANLNELLARIVDDYGQLAVDARITLRAEFPEKPVEAEVDPTRFTQMVTNLLQNAVKFTPEDGFVTIALAREGDRVLVSVRDSGTGIEPGTLERLFEPFAQGRQRPARGPTGLGLGLAIVKGIAELHGGTIRARSDGFAKGSEFTIELPA